MPVHAAITFLALWQQGITLNIMTLGGLAVAVGRVVDDAIVVLESIYRHVQRGENPRTATLQGTKEVALAITASVQLVGVYLVFATLILPAIATHGLGEKRGLVTGYALAIGGYALGLWLSVPFDLPAGPAIVCVLAGLVVGMGVMRGMSRR